MADEESEVRRMAEIADAINSILESEPAGIGDTPSQPASSPRTEPTSDEPVSGAPTSDEPISSDLDAAIAAEFAEGGALDGAPHNDAFGPVPALDLPGIHAPIPEANHAPNHAIGQEVLPGSEMADLSMRMQDTLAEIRNQSNAAWQGADEMLAEMEAARNALVTDLRGQISQIEQETQKRRQQIMEQLEALESQSLMARDEMEIMLVKYESRLNDMHKQYFDNAQIERERLGRYREFLQFLLDERGM